MIAYFGAAGYVDESSRIAQKCFCHSVSQHTEDCCFLIVLFVCIDRDAWLGLGLPALYLLYNT